MPLNIAIVTSANPRYAVYLNDWATSITRLTVKPTQCRVVLNGRDAAAQAHVDGAIAILRTAGIDARSQTIDATDFGTARNAAVALSSTEWVMHLDADDMVMPHCLADVAAIAPDADVVSLGYERCGDLAAGPRNRTKTYRTHQGQATLRDPTPCSGVSPFRRSFWERSPYRTDMKGGWDTALWIGFAHLNARFRPTRRPCFWYRQHADSVFNTRRKDWLKSALVGTKLQLLRSAPAGVSVLIPWRSDGGARDHALEWVERRYAALHPDWQVVRGTCTGEWRKGAAIRDALSRATGTTLVIADADCVVSPDALREAVSLVERGAPWVVPHSLVHRLDETATRRIVAGPVETVDFTGRIIRPAYEGYAGGGIVVVDHAVYLAVHGMPEVFTGWGCEDEALALILDTFAGRHVRLPHNLWHLWHPPGRRMRDASYHRNAQILRRYRQAAADPARLWQLITSASPVGASVSRLDREQTARTTRQQQLAAALERRKVGRKTGTTYLQARRRA